MLFAFVLAAEFWTGAFFENIVCFWSRKHIWLCPQALFNFPGGSALRTTQKNLTFGLRKILVCKTSQTNLLFGNKKKWFGPETCFFDTKRIRFLSRKVFLIQGRKKRMGKKKIFNILGGRGTPCWLPVLISPGVDLCTVHTCMYLRIQMFQFFARTHVSCHLWVSRPDMPHTSCRGK